MTVCCLKENMDQHTYTTAPGLACKVATALRAPSSHRPSHDLPPRPPPFPTLPQNWLYEEGEDETKSVYVAKLGEFKALGGPVEARAANAAALPAAADSLRRACQVGAGAWKRQGWGGCQLAAVGVFSASSGCVVSACRFPCRCSVWLPPAHRVPAPLGHPLAQGFLAALNEPRTAHLDEADKQVCCALRKPIIAGWPGMKPV